MKNQHQKITGYRDLSQAEIDLMNKIKAHGKATQELIGEVNDHLTRQRAAASASDPTESMRVNEAEPGRWASIARTDFQTGLMALTRAVAQPGSF